MKLSKKIIIATIMVIMAIIVVPNVLPELQSAYIVEAATIRLNKTKVTLNVGENYVLKIKGTNKKVTWSTSNKKVATVNANGKVKAKKAGTVTITAKVAGKKYKCKVKVENPVLSCTKKVMNVGESYTLKVKGTSQKITWQTSNKNVATINANGKIKAKKTGTVTIVAKIGSTKYKCKITIENPKISKISYTMNVGETYTLQMSGTTQKITWSTSDASKATINSNGKITAKKAGSAVVYAKIGSTKYSCKIVIEEPILNKTNVTLNLDEFEYLTLKGTTRAIVWSTSNNSIIEVDNDGEICAVGIGTATISAKVGNSTYKCNVTVNDLKLNYDKKQLYIGEEENLYFNNIELDSSKITWSTSNKSVVIVDKYGCINAVGQGTAIISAKVANKTYTCNVTVKSFEDNIKISYLKTNYSVVALLTNNNDVAISIEPTMIFYDSNGNIQSTDSNYNYCFEPNSTIALKFESYDTNSLEYQDFSTYKMNLINVERSLYDKYESKNIEVITSETSDKLIATVTNKSQNKLDTIQICAIFYDSDGNCIGYDERYPECYKNGDIDYVNLYYPYDEEYNSIIPASYSIYVNSAYAY